MHILLWVLQVLGALVFGASGIMKVFMFDKVSVDVPSFGALRSGHFLVSILGNLRYDKRLRRPTKAISMCKPNGWWHFRK